MMGTLSSTTFRRFSAMVPLTIALAAWPAAAQDTPDEPADAGFVVKVQADDIPTAAVVIGVSTYENLPAEAHLDYARSEAATIAGALRETGGYDYAFLLADRQATRATIEQTLRVKVPQLVGRNGILLVYYVGHGIGGDFDAPALFTHEATVENAQRDGLDVATFAGQLANWSKARTTLIVTDAIHANQLDGLEFIGPSAQQWPGMGPDVLIISSTQTDVPAAENAFGPAFAAAMGGDADTNRDSVITAAELKDYLTLRMTAAGQLPAFVGNFADDLPVAVDVTRAKVSIDDVLDPTKAQEGIYADHEVSKAKFVFRDGAQATVQCREQDIQVCDDTCYVHQFLAGPCRLQAMVNGKQVSGFTLAMVPGRYDCDLRSNGTIGCLPPQATETVPTATP